MSAMLSAPATSEHPFNPAFAPLSVGTVSQASANWASPAFSANAITGTNPAADTKFGSSNTADVAAGLWHNFICQMAFRFGRICFSQNIFSQVRGHLIFHRQPVSPTRSVHPGLESVGEGIYWVKRDQPPNPMEITVNSTSTNPAPLEGMTALVTGGTDGIGLSIARSLLADGARVCVTGRTREKADAAALSIERSAKDRFLTHLADAGRPQDREGAVARTVDAFGGISILVNNAGTTVRGKPQECELADYEAVLNVNLTAGLHLSQLAFPYLSDSGNGRIINIASLFSTYGSPFSLPYSVSKGGIVQLTKSLAVAWAQDGILVNAIAPGWIDTALTKSTRCHVPSLDDKVVERTPLSRWGRPEEIGAVAAFLAGPSASFVNGTVITVDGGYSAAA